jgi:fructosamine-3-kinase
MITGTQARIESALGARVLQAKPVSGGDINDAWRIELSDGRRAFVKSNLTAPKGMFPAEAKGLAWLREPNVIRVPEVYAVCRDDATGQAAFLVLEWIEAAAKGARFDECLGQSLAALHQSGAPGFGFVSNNFIGSLPQENQTLGDWCDFFWKRRLEPQVKRALAARKLDASIERSFDKLRQKLPELFPTPEPPARLHGDLWGGNLHVDDRGMPCLIDPAVYGGHREMDLGMMRLFGGFSSRVFEAYAEAFPLAENYEERIPLTQLYPLLVHVNLFGGGYAESVKKTLNRYA